MNPVLLKGTAWDLNNVLIPGKFSTGISPELIQDMIAVKSMVLVVAEHVREQKMLKSINFLRNGYALSLKHIQVGLHGEALIAGMSHQHFVQHHADGPDIALFRVFVLLVGLRGHVFGRANVVEHLGLVWHLLHRAVSEINYRNGPALLMLKQDVVRFEVAVNNLLIFNTLVTLEDLPKDVHRFVDRQSLRMLLDVLGKSSSFEQL